MYLDTKLNFYEHLNNVLSKLKKTIGLFWKLHALLPRQSLVTVYKAFIRPHSDYGILFTNKLIMNPFIKKWCQYNNTALTITGAIRGTSREKTLPRTRLRITP